MMSENENLIEQAGQVIEGELLRTMDVRGYLAFMSVSIGRVPYSALVRVAREIGLGREYVPFLRDLKGSFSVARQTLDGMPLPMLSELEGWDGQVKQTILCKPLTGTREYQVSIESRGQMRGRMHRESTPVMRLSYNEPENFSSTRWVTDFEDSHWDGDTETPDVNDIRNCLEIEPYWTGDSLDVAITQVVFTQVLNEFTSAATSIDDVALSTFYLKSVFWKSLCISLKVSVLIIVTDN